MSFSKEETDIDLDSNKSFNEVLNEFMKYLKFSDIEAVNIFESSKDLFRKNFSKNLFKELQEYIEKYDLDKAYYILNEIGDNSNV